MDTSFVKRVGCLYRVIVLLFFALLGLQSYWHLVRSDAMARMPENRRPERLENSVPRGSIFDRRDTLLAQTKQGERVYADAGATAAVLGYIDPALSRVGLEKQWNAELSGYVSGLGVPELQRMARNEPRRGDDLVLTLDLGLQQAARQALGAHAGALVALDPATGAILALATSPTFDPRNLNAHWKTLRNDPAKPLLNRAMQEFYPPGSTMKLVTAAAALAHDIPPTTTYTCVGSMRKYGVQITDFSGHRHGTLAMPMALRVSCNNYFAQLAAEMPGEEFAATAGQFGFGTAWWKDRDILSDPRILPVPLATSSLTPHPDEPIAQGERAHMGFGQSTVVATPLQMAMVVGGIANNGTVVAPYLVSALRKGGSSMVLKSFHSGVVGQPLTTEQAQTLAAMMQDVVEHGTGRNARTRGLTVYGKTGTAQQTGGRDHAWFVGFAEPTDESAPASRIAFAVLIERGGSTGGEMAAPIARNFLEYWRDHR